MKLWTFEQDKTLLQMYDRGTPEREIARSFHTTEEEVKERVEYLEKTDLIDVYV